MAVAHDTQTRFPTTDNTFDTTTGDRTFSHVGAATAGGAKVDVLTNVSGIDVVTGVLYGGVAMTLEQLAEDTTEQGRISSYTLAGPGFPTGTQTVTLQGCTGHNKWAVCSTVTVAAGQEAAVDVSGKVDTTTSANPAVTVTLTTTARGYIAAHSGLAAPPTAGIDTTIQHNGDYGTRSSCTARKNANESAGSRTINVVGASDDWCATAVYFSEVAPGAVLPPPPVIVRQAVNRSYTY